MGGDGQYPPIGDYALLSNSFAGALVSSTGSIDWACVRRFDAGSCFGRILDWRRGGFFSIEAREVVERSRSYVDASLVLCSEVRTGGGAARVTDLLVMPEESDPDPPHLLLRLIDGLAGEVVFDAWIEPRFDYGQMRPWVRGHAGKSENFVYSAVGGDDALVFSSDVELAADDRTYRFTGSFAVTAGERVRLCAEHQPAHRFDPSPYTPQDQDRLAERTIAWWRDWSAATQAAEPYYDQVRQSVAVLKGLSCAPTGAIIAAMTTSLPETVGGSRNWDYRYSWVRDASLSMAALSLAGHPEMAQHYRDFLLRSAAGHVEDLQIAFGCYGEHELPERVLDLEGYRGSAPVRVGNDAAQQTQLDVYGHILDAAQFWALGDADLDEGEAAFLRDVANAAADRWREPDRGLWEMRGEPQQFTHSKVMMWVALDRALALARDYGDSDADDSGSWRTARDEIRHAVDAHGVCDGGWFTQTFDNDSVDGSLLRLPLLGFVEAGDGRMVATVERIREQLSVGYDGLIRRYRSDDVEDGANGQEGAFLLCSFWLVEVMVLQDRAGEARALYERLLDTSNDLGLFSEEFDPDTGELLGNFPQAFTHLAMINASHRLGGAPG